MTDATRELDEPAALDLPVSASLLRELAYLDPRNWRSFFAGVDKEFWVICIVAAVGLTIHEMVFRSSLAAHYLSMVAPEWVYEVFRGDPAPWRDLVRYAWWAGGIMLVWVVLPLTTSWLLLKRGPRDYGLNGTPLRKLPPYLALLAVMVPIVVAAAFILPGFRDKYPLYAYKDTWSLTNLLIFELIYSSQFFAVEFFFRGYLVSGLGRSIGARAILVSMMPYVMIHFHKPLLEALGAIVAGTILGAFALRTRSIWGGLMVHLGVAWSMDFFSLLAGSRGGFPYQW